MSVQDINYFGINSLTTLWAKISSLFVRRTELFDASTNKIKGELIDESQIHFPLTFTYID